jgi:propionyl-CoA carboxylase beta chain
VSQTPPTMAESIDGLQARRDESLYPGKEGSIEKHHAKGKLTARERIELLVDPGSFLEVGRLRRAPLRSQEGHGELRPYGDGVVTGRATIDGRPVCVFSQDATVFGGSVGQTFAEKMVRIMDLAGSIGCPIIGLADSAGARIQEGVTALANYQKVGLKNVQLSGVVPQLSLIMGTCAGGAVYSPALGDFTFMVDGTSHMFLTGPEVVREVTGQETTMEELGGAEINAITGNCHHVDDNDEESLLSARRLLSFLPSNNVAQPPRFAPSMPNEFVDADYELDTYVPAETTKGYDVIGVIERVVDDGDFFEIHAKWAKSIVIGFARIDGRSVGIIANQPIVNAGTLNIDSTEKAARFLRTCDAFNVPIVSFVDVPGYMPGIEQERGGAIRRGAKLFYGYADAKVPTVTVTLRKAYGGAYATMGSKHSDNDVNLAWPTAEIAVMGAQGGVKIVYGRELLAAMQNGEDVEALYNQRIADYQAEHQTPYPAAERGWVDKVIKPHETRLEIAKALELMEGRRHDAPLRAHGNIPL